MLHIVGNSVSSTQAVMGGFPINAWQRNWQSQMRTVAANLIEIFGRLFAPLQPIATRQTSTMAVEVPVLTHSRRSRKIRTSFSLVSSLFSSRGGSPLLNCLETSRAPTHDPRAPPHPSVGTQRTSGFAHTCMMTSYILDNAPRSAELRLHTAQTFVILP